MVNTFSWVLGISQTDRETHKKQTHDVIFVIKLQEYPVGVGDRALGSGDTSQKK